MTQLSDPRFSNSRLSVSPSQSPSHVICIRLCPVPSNWSVVCHNFCKNVNPCSFLFHNRGNEYCWLQQTVAREAMPTRLSADRAFAARLETHSTQIPQSVGPFAFDNLIWPHR